MDLKTYREQRGVSVNQTAEALGVDPWSIYRYEAGRVPRTSVMRRIVEWTSGLVTAADFYAAPEPARSGSDGAASPAPGGTGDPVASDARPAALRRGSAGRPLSVTSAAGRKAAETRKRRRAAGAEVGA